MNAKSKFDREDIESQEEKKSSKKTARKGRGRSRSQKYEKDRHTNTANKNPRTNDVSWYANDPVLLHNAASFSFNNPLGNSLRITELAKLHSSIDTTNLQYLDTALPGVMRLNYSPAVGYSKDMYSQINIAGRAIFSAVRAGLSGNWKDYDPAEQMKYILSVDSAYAIFAYFLRIYGLARVYAQQNRYWPRAILESMGLDVEDIVSNLSDFRFYINTFATRINSLSVPADINIFARHFMLNRTLWSDANGEKVQLYYFAPNFLYQYDAMNHTPAALVPFTMPKSSDSFKTSQLIDLAENLIQPLLNNEDVGVISGDFLKALGISGLMKLPLCEIDELTVPVADATVLHQIHNMQFVGADFETREAELTFTITELTTQDGNAGALVQNPNISVNMPEQGSIRYVPNLVCDLPKLLDVHGIEEVSPEVIMEITRMIPVTKSLVADGRYQATITSYGTEVATSYEIFTLKADGSLAVLKGDSTLLLAASTPITKLTQMSQFNLHPLLMCIRPKLSNGKCELVIGEATTPYFGDIENYSVLATADIQRLHDCALLGLFNVPRYGVYFSKRLG